ncbi:YggT family protein [Galactobacter valiniphilus]|uniref:YggT family protein n=1 Tax=Galactobacter valiniphilus TaxID=2676122 RepID=A0A399JBQ1_9MICC|nr:YggT family protein [Galactobacter valiniphilus]RII42968.1 YggT family protein [Galactobacter valiniphilus]
MSTTGAILGLVYFLLTVIMLLLMARIVVDFVQLFARSWRPQGAALVFASTVYRTTDPPLKWVRRIIPPLNLGGMRLDLSFIVVFFVVSILQRIVLSIGQNL